MQLFFCDVKFLFSTDYDMEVQHAYCIVLTCTGVNECLAQVSFHNV